MSSLVTPPDTPPPGWYADPWGHATHRWWDGAAWTGHLASPGQQPAQAAAHEEPAPAARPSLADAVAQQERAERDREQALPRLDADAFEITQRFRMTINEYDVMAVDGGMPLASVRQKRLALRERIELWTDAGQSSLVCAVQARKALEVRGTYDVIDQLGRRIGVLQKLAAKSILRSSWQIHDDAGILQATVTEASLPIAIVRRVQGLADMIPVVGWAIGMIPIPFGFVFRGPDGAVIGEHRRIFGVRDRYRLTLDGDPQRRLDRRLAVSLAICLDALQSR